MLKGTGGGWFRGYRPVPRLYPRRGVAFCMWLGVVPRSVAGAFVLPGAGVWFCGGGAVVLPGHGGVWVCCVVLPSRAHVW